MRAKNWQLMPTDWQLRPGEATTVRVNESFAPLLFLVNISSDVETQGSHLNDT